MPYVIVLNCIPVSSLWNAKNWLCPAVERLGVPVSIVVTVYLHAGIP